MKTKVDLDTVPFDIPRKIMVKSPTTSGPDIELPLCAFDGCTLERMCQEFTDAIFKTSGVQRPPMDGSMLRACK